LDADETHIVIQHMPMNSTIQTDYHASASPHRKDVNSQASIRQTQPRVLVVEDDPDIASLLVYILENDNFKAAAAADCQSARGMLASELPDLVLLDWMLPDMSGIEFLRRLRNNSTFGELPVIMLTARGEEADRVCGLESGADDYVVKPFSPRELCARINSRLRIADKKRSDTLEIGGLSLNQNSYRTSVNGTHFMLGPTEFKLLRHFMHNRERVLTRGQLLDSVWGTNVYVEERTVDVHIRRLRKALEPFDKDDLIQTVRGAGYRFSDCS
jgi:two-component system phosphate regulon response regulator PhoB